MSSKNKKTTETEAVMTAEETVIEKPATKTTKGVSVMYIGPSIPGVVRTSTVFKNGVLPEALKKCVEAKPYMKKLLVPLAELSAAIKELNSDSALNSIYRKVKKEF